MLRLLTLPPPPPIDIIEVSWKYDGQIYSTWCVRTSETKIEYDGDKRQLIIHDILSMGGLCDITSMVKINACEVRLVL